MRPFHHLHSQPTRSTPSLYPFSMMPTTPTHSTASAPCLLFLLIAPLLLSPSSLLASALPVPRGLIPLNSTAGTQLLRTASHTSSFWQLSMHLDAQVNLGFCGPATVASVLNAMSPEGVDAPVSPTYTASYGSFHESFRYFVQQELFNQVRRKRRKRRVGR